MTTDKTFIEMIRRNNGIPSSAMIKKILQERSGRQDFQKKLYQRFKAEAEGTPIKNRDYIIAGVKQVDKINNQINNDFFSEIINVKTGFFAGYPITYALDSKAVLSKDEWRRGTDIITRFLKAENIADLDVETTKNSATCGDSARLMYVGKDGEAHIKNLFPWEVVVLTLGKFAEPVYSFYHYVIEELDADNANAKKIDVVEFYDQRFRYEFRNEGANTEYTLVYGSDKPHLLDFCPLYPFINNEERQGDCEKVLALIDAYDRLVSDWDNELEQFRLAYMKFKGCTISTEELLKARQNGAFNLPNNEMDADFITKLIQVDAIEKLLKIIENNIYQFSQSVNSRDEHFAGTVTGVALHHKLTPLEQKCLIMERKFVSSLAYQFKLLTAFWASKRVANIDYLNINFTFKRKYPQNLEAEAAIAQQLRGIVSDRTLLENISLVKDVDEELKRLAEEALSRAKEINLDEGEEPGYTPTREESGDGRAA